MENRWAEFVAPTITNIEEAASEVPAPPEDVLRGVSAPQLGMRNLPDDERQLAQAEPAGPAPFWVGAHGGAGETTLARLIGGTACDHRWPMNAEALMPFPVFLVARLDHEGLAAASLAARDWASGRRTSVNLLGLVAIASAPGKTPRELGRQLQILSGGVPRTWIIPWIEELRLSGTATRGNLTRETEKRLLTLEAAATQHLHERKNS